MIIAAIAGGAAGVLTFLATGAGLVASPSPGSIVAYLAVTPRGGYFGVLLGTLIAAAVSFVIGVVVLRLTATHSPVNRLTDATADVVVVQSALSGRARQVAPSTVIVPFTMFMGDPAFDRLEGAIRDDQVLEG